MHPAMKQTIESNCWSEPVEKMARYAAIVHSTYNLSDEELETVLSIIKDKLKSHMNKSC